MGLNALTLCDWVEAQRCPLAPLAVFCSPCLNYSAVLVPAASRLFSRHTLPFCTSPLKLEAPALLSSAPQAAEGIQQEDLNSCPICLDDLTMRTITSCGHHFCPTCIREVCRRLGWLQRQLVMS